MPRSSSRRGGRPRLPLEAKRKVFSVRYTDHELEHLRGQAHRAGCAVSDYVRRTSLGHRVLAAPGPRPADPATIAEINRLSLQLSALGNLANQVARSIHTGRRMPEGWQELPQEIAAAQLKAAATLDRLLGGEGPHDVH